MVQLFTPSTIRAVQLEGPQEVSSLFEVGPNCDNLVDQVLHTDDSTFTYNERINVQYYICVFFSKMPLVKKCGNLSEGEIIPYHSEYFPHVVNLELPFLYDSIC